MRELDVVLTHFLEHHYNSADSELQAAFCDLLACEDPEIFAYLTGRVTPADVSTRTLIEHLVDPSAGIASR